MVAVFAGFAVADVPELSQWGFGLGAAVLIDATIIRILLVAVVHGLARETPTGTCPRGSSGSRTCKFEAPSPALVDGRKGTRAGTRVATSTGVARSSRGRATRPANIEPIETPQSGETMSRGTRRTPAPPGCCTSLSRSRDRRIPVDPRRALRRGRRCATAANLVERRGLARSGSSRTWRSSSRRRSSPCGSIGCSAPSTHSRPACSRAFGLVNAVAILAGVALRRPRSTGHSRAMPTPRSCSTSSSGAMWGVGALLLRTVAHPHGVRHLSGQVMPRRPRAGSSWWAVSRTYAQRLRHVPVP